MRLSITDKLSLSKPTIAYLWLFFLCGYHIFFLKMLWTWFIVPVGASQDLFYWLLIAVIIFCCAVLKIRVEYNPETPIKYYFKIFLISTNLLFLAFATYCALKIMDGSNLLMNCIISTN